MSRRFTISLACALVASMATMQITAQKATSAASKRPKLVVGIVIEGLDIDRVMQLRDFFGANGFNRLLTKGLTINNLDYGGATDATAATAVIFTGASPAVSGIDGADYFDATQRRTVPIFFDANAVGNFTNETYSPANLRVSTLTDELRIDGGGTGVAHSITAEPSLAIIMGGHAGNSAVWLNDATGRWATTTYYPEMPTTVRTANHTSPLSTRIDTIVWKPALPEGVYSFLPQAKRNYAFNHTFPASDPRRYQAWSTSPKYNAEVTNVAADYVKSMSLGSRQSIDMLNISYDLTPYTFSRTEGDVTAETLDSYLRLDTDLSRLFGAIDAIGPGMNNTLVFVAGTPAPSTSRRDDQRWRIPTGEFSTARAVSLLNVNLMSIFGNGDWVSGMHDGQIFLNRDLISSRGVDLDAVRAETARFMRLMSGVSHAATLDEVMSGAAPSIFPSADHIVISHAGDVFVAINPGWSVTGSNIAGNDDYVVRADRPYSAAFILYPDVDARTIDTPVDARTIAPTIARILRIRSPNGASAPALR